MPKRIRNNENVYIASDILGIYEDGQYVAQDEKNNVTLNPNNINDKIKIYERQVKEWFINRAVSLTSEKNDFIILMICMSYFEGVEEYKTGGSSNGRSRQFLINSLHRIYANQFDDESYDRLYSQSRCGLFHNGMTRGDIIIDRSFVASLEFTEENIKINPKKLLLDIKDDFKKYIQDLQNENNTELRDNFNRMYFILP